MANGEIVKIPQTSEKEQIRNIIIDLAKKHTKFNRAFTLPSHSPIFEKELVKQGMNDIYCVENDIDTFIECKKNILPQMNLYHKNAIDLIRELSEDNSLLFDLAWFDFCGFFNTNKAKECIDNIQLADEHIIALTLTRNHRKLPLDKVMNTMNVTHRYDYTSNMAMTTFIGTKGKTKKMPKAIKLSNKNKNMKKSNTKLKKPKLRSTIMRKFEEDVTHVNRHNFPSIPDPKVYTKLARIYIRLLSAIRSSMKLSPQRMIVYKSLLKQAKTSIKREGTNVTTFELEQRVSDLLSDIDYSINEEINEDDRQYIISVIDDTIGESRPSFHLINVENLKERFSKVTRREEYEEYIEQHESQEQLPETFNSYSYPVINVKSLQPKEIIVKNGKYNMKTGDLEGEFSFVY